VPSLSRRALLALAALLFATAASDFPEVVFIPEVGPKLPVPAGGITAASVGIDSISGGWQAVLTFSPELRAAFATMTEANIGKKVRIYLDGELLIEPVVREPIIGGRMIVTPVTKAQAERLATLANWRN
jgi:preprotein translocase subunit SecD